jgi:ABC transporter substrate binding protein
MGETVEQLPELVAELVHMNVRATKTIPIVFSNHADPIGVGHVASLPRPGGNITGLSELATELNAKALEILSRAAGNARRSTLESQHALAGARFAVGQSRWRKTRAGAGHGVRGHSRRLRAALASIARESAGGLFVVPSPLTLMQPARRAELAFEASAADNVRGAACAIHGSCWRGTATCAGSPARVRGSCPGFRRTAARSRSRCPLERV